MKTYGLKFSVKLAHNLDDYSPSYAINFEIRENLPANVDAQAYLRKRLAEELKRHFDAMLPDAIDNKTEEAKSTEDPLAPF